MSIANWAENCARRSRGKNENLISDLNADLVCLTHQSLFSKSLSPFLFLQRAVGRLTGEIREDGSSTVRLLLASRTDKGVHAMGQVNDHTLNSRIRSKVDDFIHPSPFDTVLIYFLF